MSVSVEVADEAELGLPSGPIAELVGAVLEAEGVSGTVSLALVDERAIGDLNSSYRGVVEPTDVLSFRYADRPGQWADPRDSDVGEIVVCPAVVWRYAIEEGVAAPAQLGWTLVHGALHLAGYDHEQDRGEMRAREQELLKQLGHLVDRLPSLGRH